MGAHPSRAVRAALARRRDRRVLVLGVEGAGKSALCRALMARAAERAAPASGGGAKVATVPADGAGDAVPAAAGAPFAVHELRLRGMRFELWDVRGSEDARKLWAHYFVGTSAVVFVVDASTGGAARVAAARAELRDVARAADLAGVPVLVAASHCDGAPEDGAAATAALDAALGAAELLDGRPHAVAPTSARADGGAGLDAVLDFLAAHARPPS